jgi:hypothetical protein
VREEADPLISPRELLRDVEWVIGDWVDEAPDSEVRVTCMTFRVAGDGPDDQKLSFSK